MTKIYKPSEIDLRTGELIRIDAGKSGCFVGYINEITERTISLQASMPGRETRTDYDNPFRFWYGNFEEPTIQITRLIDTSTGLEKTIQVYSIHEDINRCVDR
ncbi:MAG: hypothetical protein ABIF40_00660 [archaeon]